MIHLTLLLSNVRVSGRRLCDTHYKCNCHLIMTVLHSRNMSVDVLCLHFVMTQLMYIFPQISDLGKFFVWAQKVLIPFLYAQKLYNGDPVSDSLQGFTDNLVYYRLGSPRLRLARVKSGTHTGNFFHHCLLRTASKIISNSSTRLVRC